MAVFAALVEFACINFIDTFVKRTKQRIEAEKAKEQEQRESDRQKMEDAILNLAAYSVPATHLTYDRNTLLLPMIDITEDKEQTRNLFLTAHAEGCEHRQSAHNRLPTLATSDEDEFEDLEEFEQEEEADDNLPQKPSRVRNIVSYCRSIPQNCTNVIFKELEIAIERHWGPLTERNFYINTTEVIWTIDAYARKMFPLVFFILSL